VSTRTSTGPAVRRPLSPARRAGLIFTGSLVALSVLAGCGSSGSGSAPAGTRAASGASTGSSGGSAAAGSMVAGSTAANSPATVAMIHIHNFHFEVPGPVSPGQQVSVMNMDGETHTVTADSGGAFDDLATAGSVTTFNAPSKPGSYPFHCAFHANMHGVLVVK
jgi:plastocyanin